MSYRWRFTSRPGQSGTPGEMFCQLDKGEFHRRVRRPPIDLARYRNPPLTERDFQILEELRNTPFLRIIDPPDPLPKWIQRQIEKYCL